jgi:hypothetical protein
MSKVTKYCPNCGAVIDESKPFCPQCGNKIGAQATSPPPGTFTPTPAVTPVNIPHEQKRGAVEHLTIGYSVAIGNPLVFLPAAISGIISLLVGATNTFVGSSGLIILQLISALVSFILSFASTDMSRDAYNKQPLDLGQSIAYVFKRFLPFLIAAILGAILSLTIVFIPIVTLTFVIMVIDETGIMDAFTKAFKVLFADIGDIIIVLVVAIIGFFITGYIPYISTLVYSVLNVVIGLAFIDIYVNYKNS